MNKEISKVKNDLQSLQATVREKQSLLEDLTIAERKKELAKNKSIAIGDCFMVRCFRGSSWYMCYRLIKIEEDYAEFSFFDISRVFLSNPSTLFSRHIQIRFTDFKQKGITTRNRVSVNEFKEAARKFVGSIYNTITKI